MFRVSYVFFLAPVIKHISQCVITC